MSLLKLPIAWFTLSIVFLAPPSQFWCKPPPSVNLTDAEWLTLSAPKEEFSRKQVDKKIYSKVLRNIFKYVEKLLNLKHTSVRVELPTMPKVLYCLNFETIRECH